MTEKIILRTSDEVLIPVDVSLMKKSQFISNMLNDLSRLSTAHSMPMSSSAPLSSFDPASETGPSMIIETTGMTSTVPPSDINLSISSESQLSSSSPQQPIIIPLINVNSVILSKVIDFLKHHQNDPEPTEESNRKFLLNPILDQWDEEFCKVDQKTLFDLIMAANYLNIKPMLNVTCKAVANMIRGKTPDQIRATFNIINDFTPEEEKAIREEYKWCLQ